MDLTSDEDVLINWAAPMFAVSTISFLLFLKGKRKELNEFHKSEKIVEEEEGNNKSGEEYEQDLGRKYFSIRSTTTYVFVKKLFKTNR